ncbi:hypothetical protein MMC25_002529 [Agyrium rufum]|nr:hypothetical protein [Agyrium rufum]
MSTHYEILKIAPPQQPGPFNSQTTSLTPEALKTAYRKALLTNHPDKSTSLSTTPTTTPSKTTFDVQQPNTKPIYSIDAITHAYRTLSNPSTRASYDQNLRLRFQHQSTPNHSSSPANNSENDLKNPSLTGLETVDLDDLTFDEEDGLWFRACRCGAERGFIISGGDLEREMEVQAQIRGLTWRSQGGEGEGEGYEEEGNVESEILVGCSGCSLWLEVGFVGV